MLHRSGALGLCCVGCNFFYLTLVKVISALTHWPLENMVVISKVQFPSTCYDLSSWALRTFFLRCMLRNKSVISQILVQVMDWCRQAKRHFMIKCWSKSMSPYGVTRSQWVELLLRFIFRNLVRYYSSGDGCWANFPRFAIFTVCQSSGNTGYLLHNKFIFDRCCRHCDTRFRSFES